MANKSGYTTDKGTAVSDDELYQKYLSGDQSAGDLLMLRYGDALTAYLTAFIHNENDAEDLMLDCFAAILVSKPKIREGNFRAYLYKVARNKANRLWRDRFRRNEFELDENLISQETSPEAKVLEDERNAALEKCLNRIAPQYREALYLVYDMDLSCEQAAGILGCKVSKVYDLLKNGKKKLREELGKEGITGEDI